MVFSFFFLSYMNSRQELLLIASPRRASPPRFFFLSLEVPKVMTKFGANLFEKNSRSGVVSSAVSQLADDSPSWSPGEKSRLSSVTGYQLALDAMLHHLGEAS